MTHPVGTKSLQLFTPAKGAVSLRMDNTMWLDQHGGSVQLEPAQDLAREIELAEKLVRWLGDPTKAAHSSLRGVGAIEAIAKKLYSALAARAGEVAR